MMMFFKLFSESIAQALHELWSNKLRSSLTLFGIIIGIMCIISVLTAVDSLEHSIKSSLNKLGDDVVYLQKYPWGGDANTDWVKIMRRPDPDFKDYKALNKKLKTADIVAYSTFVGGGAATFKSNTVEGVYCLGTTYGYGEIFNVEFDKGRYFSSAEHFYGGNQVIIGHKAATELFGNIEPIGKKIKLFGRKFQVIGVIKKEGKDLINPVNFDEAVIMSINTAKRIVNLDKGAMIVAKASKDVSLDQLKGDITSVIRANRRLKPKQEDNFALNQLSIIANFFDQIFNVLTMAGWFIGVFSIIVGMFGVANIMFVSVKERTSIIGVKKALGAQRYVILLEFMIEAIVLCLIGGSIGLVTVFGLTEIFSQVIDFEFFLSSKNVAIGAGISIFTGLLAGVIPAFMASNLDPVVAMRQ